MAIVNGEYGPYDDATGRPLSTNESGTFWGDTGGLYTPTVATSPSIPGLPSGFDQYGNEASGLDWLKSQFGGPGSSTSTAMNALKTVLGGSGGGSGGGNTFTICGSFEI